MFYLTLFCGVLLILYPYDLFCGVRLSIYLVDNFWGVLLFILLFTDGFLGVLLLLLTLYYTFLLLAIIADLFCSLFFLGFNFILSEVNLSSYKLSSSYYTIPSLRITSSCFFFISNAYNILPSLIDAFVFLFIIFILINLSISISFSSKFTKCFNCFLIELFITPWSYLSWIVVDTNFYFIYKSLYIDCLYC